jgi:hypothetical protein
MIALISIVISLCALGVSIFSICAVIRHHKLSVTPRLIRHMNRARKEDGIVITTELCNHGIGPAKIKKFSLFLDGKPFTEKWDPIESLIESALAGKVPYELLRQAYPGKDYHLIAGQTYLLAEIFLPGAQKSDEKNLNEHFRRMQFRIDYESLYGVPFHLDTREKDEPKEAV